MLIRCEMTAQAAVSYGEVKQTGRRPGSAFISRPTAGSRSPTAGYSVPSASREKTRATCLSTAAMSSLPATSPRRAPSSKRRSTATGVKLPSSRKVIRTAPGSCQLWRTGPKLRPTSLAAAQEKGPGA